MSDRGRERRRPPKGLRYVVYAGLGVVVLMMVALSAAVFLGGQGPAGPDYPAAQFEYEYDEANGSLRVELVNGTRFTAEDTAEVSVRIDGEVVSYFQLPAGEGDAVRLGGIDPGTVVRVYWEDPEGTNIQIDRQRVGGANATATTGS